MTKQMIEKITDEYMCLPRRMSVTEQLDWIEKVCTQVAEAAKKEKRKRILTLLSEEAKFELFKTEAIIAQQEALLSNNKKGV